MKAYTVQYKKYECGPISPIVVLAHNAEEAYHKANEYLGRSVYSLWVKRVTLNNGRVKTFNNFEGHPY